MSALEFNKHSQNFIFWGEWVTPKIFFLRFQKNFHIYSINPVQSNIFSCYLDFSLNSRKNIISLNRIQNKKYLIFCLSSYIIFILTPFLIFKKAFYFLGLKIKNIFQIKLNRNLFYLVGNEFVIAPLNKKKDNFFKLYLLNINEMKFISLLNLNSYSNDNNLNFILKNDNFLIIYEKDKILVFTYQETLNKILKYTFYIKREIFSIDILGNTIIFGDEDGCVSILTLSNKNSNNCLYISFIRKVKLGNTPILIKCFINSFSVLIYLNKKNVLLNLYNYKLISDNCSFLEFLGKLFWLKFCPKKTNLMVLNENLQFFVYSITFFEKKFQIYSPVCHFEFSVKNRVCFYTNKIKLYHSSFKSNEIFFLIGCEAFKKTSQFANIFPKKTRNNIILPVKSSPFFIDSVGRQILLTNKHTIVKLLNSNSILIDFILNTKFLYGKKNNDFIGHSKNLYKLKSSFSGNKIAVLKKKRLFEIFIQKWKGDTFEVKKILKISLREKCLCFNISKNGDFLILTYASIVQIWRLIPKIEKIFFKRFTFSTIPNYINFFSGNIIRKILISTDEEVFLYDILKNNLIYLLKLKIRQVIFDKWGVNYIILTDSFFSFNIKHYRSYFIFKKETPIPILVISNNFFQEIQFSSITFGWKNKNFNQQSVVLVNSLLNVFFLKY